MAAIAGRVESLRRLKETVEIQTEELRVEGRSLQLLAIGKNGIEALDVHHRAISICYQGIPVRLVIDGAYRLDRGSSLVFQTKRKSQGLFRTLSVT